MDGWKAEWTACVTMGSRRAHEPCFAVCVRRMASDTTAVAVEVAEEPVLRMVPNISLAPEALEVALDALETRAGLLGAGAFAQISLQDGAWPWPTLTTQYTDQATTAQICAAAKQGVLVVKDEDRDGKIFDKRVMIVANVVPRPPRTEMVKQEITSKGASDRIAYSVYISIYSGVRSDRGTDCRLGLKTSVT